MLVVAFLPQVFRLLADFGAGSARLPIDPAKSCHGFATPLPQMWIALNGVSSALARIEPIRAG
jgi:hypothetical protein